MAYNLTGKTIYYECSRGKHRFSDWITERIVEETYNGVGYFLKFTDEVENINFENDTYLTYVEIGDGFQTFSDNAFSGCTHLESIIFNNEQVSFAKFSSGGIPVDGFHFNKCSSLKYIRFAGYGVLMKVNRIDSINGIATGGTVVYKETWDGFLEIPTNPDASINNKDMPQYLINNFSWNGIESEEGLEEFERSGDNPFDDVDDDEGGTDNPPSDGDDEGGTDNPPSDGDMIPTPEHIVYDCDCEHSKPVIERPISETTIWNLGLTDWLYFETFDGTLPSKLQDLGITPYEVEGNSGFIFSCNTDKLDDELFSSTSITHIEIPNKIKVIGKRCFRNCQHLNYVYWDYTNLDETKQGEMLEEAFSYCTSLKHFAHNDNMRGLKIWDKAFWHSGLEEFIFPKGTIFAMGAWQFADCPSLSWVGCEDGNKGLVVGNNPEKSRPNFDTTYGFDDGYGMFQNCSNLECVKVWMSPNLPALMFDKCTNLNCIDITDKNGILFTNQIGFSCFNRCYNLEHINFWYGGENEIYEHLPNRIEEAFTNTSITEFDFPTSLTDLAYNFLPIKENNPSRHFTVIFRGCKPRFFDDSTGNDNTKHDLLYPINCTFDFLIPSACKESYDEWINNYLSKNPNVNVIIYDNGEPPIPPEPDDKCDGRYIKFNYDLGSLDNTIYLFPRNTTSMCKQMDEVWNGHIREMLGNGKSLHCDSVVYNTSSNTTDTRYSFNPELRIRLNESLLDTHYQTIIDLISTDYIIVFKDKNKNQFIFNTEYKYNATYNYNFNDSEDANYCEISFKAMQNEPLFNYNGDLLVDGELRNDLCGYNYGSITSLSIIPISECKFDIKDDKLAIIDTTKPLFTIKANEGTIQIIESLLENGMFNQTVSFDLPLNEDNHYMAYNTLEFMTNRYLAVFETKNGNRLVFGANGGLFPNTSVSTSESDTTLNAIGFRLEGFFNSPNIFNLVDTIHTDEPIDIPDYTFDDLFDCCEEHPYYGEILGMLQTTYYGQLPDSQGKLNDYHTQQLYYETIDGNPHDTFYQIPGVYTDDNLVPDVLRHEKYKQGYIVTRQVLSTLKDEFWLPSFPDLGNVDGMSALLIPRNVRKVRLGHMRHLKIINLGRVEWFEYGNTYHEYTTIECLGTLKNLTYIGKCGFSEWNTPNPIVISSSGKTLDVNASVHYSIFEDSNITRVRFKNSKWLDSDGTTFFEILIHSKINVLVLDSVDGLKWSEQYSFQPMPQDLPYNGWLIIPEIIDSRLLEPLRRNGWKIFIKNTNEII